MSYVSTERPVTELLRLWSEGDRSALDGLMDLVYADLQAMSRRAMAGERPGHTLEPTSLIAELYLRLVRLKQLSWEGRTPFFAFAARVMRQILVEHARALNAAKRGGNPLRADVDLANLEGPLGTVDVLALDQALERLEAQDPRLVRIIELRFFAGMTEREIATSLQISRATVQRDWVVARRWLARELSEKAER